MSDTRADTNFNALMNIGTQLLGNISEKVTTSTDQICSNNFTSWKNADCQASWNVWFMKCYWSRKGDQLSTPKQTPSVRNCLIRERSLIIGGRAGKISKRGQKILTLPQIKVKKSWPSTQHQPKQLWPSPKMGLVAIRFVLTWKSIWTQEFLIYCRKIYSEIPISYSEKC